jgi:hypothetical protein
MLPDDVQVKRPTACPLPQCQAAAVVIRLSSGTPGRRPMRAFARSRCRSRFPGRAGRRWRARGYGSGAVRLKNAATASAGLRSGALRRSVCLGPQLGSGRACRAAGSVSASGGA